MCAQQVASDKCTERLTVMCIHSISLVVAYFLPFLADLKAVTIGKLCCFSFVAVSWNEDKVWKNAESDITSNGYIFWCTPWYFGVHSWYFGVHPWKMALYCHGTKVNLCQTPNQSYPQTGKYFGVSPFRTALRRNTYLTLFTSNLSPNRSCNSKGVKHPGKNM